MSYLDDFQVLNIPYNQHHKCYRLYSNPSRRIGREVANLVNDLCCVPLNLKQLLSIKMNFDI